MKVISKIYMGVLLLGGTLAPAADFHVTPEGGGDQSGSSWGNALSPSAINQVFNERMQPGDRLLLGSGTYQNPALRLRVGGNGDAPKTIEGVNRGSGFPILRGTWSADAPSKGPTAIRIDAGVSDVRLSNIGMASFTYGIRVPEAKGAAKAERLQFNNIDMAHIRHGFYVADCTDLTLEHCDLRRYTKHGFRFDGGCEDVRLSQCTADCSMGDADWEKKTELFPFGFVVNESKRPQARFVFEDCVAKNNVMPLQKGTYKNGDGFVIERSTSDVQFIRCRAIRNQDGGFDLKVHDVKLEGCIAVGNSRGFRLWDTGTLVNCFAGWCGNGLWSNGGAISVTRSTFYSLRDAAVLTDDRSTGVTLHESIVASCARATRSTSKGKTNVNDTVLSDMPGATAEVSFVGPSDRWEGLSDAMNSVSHPDKGYRFSGK
jgi:hypothetical protein